MLITEITQRVVWHASYTPRIKQFRFLTHLGTWTAAAERALGKEFSPTPVDLFYLPVYMYHVNMSACRQGIQIYDDSNLSDPLDLVNVDLLPKEIRAVWNSSVYNRTLKRKMPAVFAEAGIDYLWYYNRVESPGSKSYVVLNPSCFVITGVEKVTPADLIRGDPAIVTNLVRRGQWPANYKTIITQLMKSQKS